ncbi:MAG: aldehyde dehydrogenase family protein [Pararhizobium sp.]
MILTLRGKHLVGGEWLDGEGAFTSSPAHGPAHSFAAGTVTVVGRACAAAEEAFVSYGYSSRSARAAFLRTIADEIEARAEAITEIGSQETGCRVLVNGFPTGVEVVDSMVHGGPYPASTNFGATSVGTMSIRKFLRPVSYQNMPEGLLPDDFLA